MWILYRDRAVWYLQHGEFSPTNADGKAVREMQLSSAPSSNHLVPIQSCLDTDIIDINVNVTAIVKEFGDALDKEADKNNDRTTLGSRFRHEKDPQGDWDMRISTSYDSAFSDSMLMCLVKSTPPSTRIKMAMVPQCRLGGKVIA